MIRTLARAGLFLAVCGAICLSSKPAGATTSLGCRVNLWIQGRTYTGSVTRSIRTSCPFARRVAAKSLTFIVKHGGEGNGDFFVNVYSPVTFKTYRMHCFAYGGEQMHVTCRGGIGALVSYVASNRS
jgi:hypothetical protein